MKEMNKVSGLVKVLENVGILKKSNYLDLFEDTHQLILELGGSVVYNERDVTYYTLFIYGIGQFDIHINHQFYNDPDVDFVKGFKLEGVIHSHSECETTLFNKSKGFTHNINILKDNGYIYKVDTIGDSLYINAVGKNMEFVWFNTSESNSDLIASITCFDRGGFAIECIYLKIISTEEDE